MDLSITSPRYNGPLVEAMPSSEQVSEMRVTSQAAPAEYGQVGDLAFIGKSGSNAFHGSLFEYLQNDAFDAQPLFTGEKPKKRNNDFGGSFSGPVMLPHYNGKDRTFFFVDYERNMQRNSVGVVNNVPTDAMLNGDFSSSSSPITNPFTGQSFAGNQDPHITDQSGIIQHSQDVLSASNGSQCRSPGYEQQLSDEFAGTVHNRPVRHSRGPGSYKQAVPVWQIQLEEYIVSDAVESGQSASLRVTAENDRLLLQLRPASQFTE